MPKTAKGKNLIFLCSCCATVIILALTTLNLVGPPNYNVLGASSETPAFSEDGPVQEIAFWQDFVSKNPDYLDGWLELTKLELEVGDKKAAANELEVARKINPNSPEIAALDKLLK